MKSLSIIIPAKNEEVSLDILLPRLKQTFPNAEIIVSNDGSTDNTEQVCKKYNVKVITNIYNLGNGGAIKAGARAATKDVLAFLDADGQHKPEDLQRLLHKYDEGYAMVVGARDLGTHAGKRRLLGNVFYNWLASKVVGHKIPDLTSGLRVVTAKHFREFIHLLPNGFSYPTTITMAFFRNGYTVGYVPIKAAKRIGQSHLKITKDGLRFFLIIFKITTLYAPLKIFFPISAIFAISGLFNYGYTYITTDRFTNMSALLLIVSIIIFIMGLLSEQITVLMYKSKTN
jgi:glycosyltransferase involved in cell wall biosynthesis